MKKLLIGFVLFVVLYFVGCIVVGGIAGGIAGAKDPENAAIAGQFAGTKAVTENRVYIAGGALALAILGCNAGALVRRSG